MNCHIEINAYIEKKTCQQSTIKHYTNMKNKISEHIQNL